MFFSSASSCTACPFTSPTFYVSCEYCQLNAGDEVIPQSHKLQLLRSTLLPTMSSPSQYSRPHDQPFVVRPSHSPRRVATATRLGAIHEDGGMQPDIPPRAHNRPMRLIYSSFPALERYHLAPPPYTEYNDIIGPKGEKFSDLRSNRYLSKRGGWLRLLIIGLIVLIIIVAVAVGLGAGLIRPKKSSRYGT